MLVLTLLLLVQSLSQLEGAHANGTTQHMTKEDCLMKRVVDVPRTDANCANKIGEFINATTYRMRELSNFKLNLDQNMIDGVCGADCRNHFDALHQQCNEYLDVVSILYCCHIQQQYAHLLNNNLVNYHAMMCAYYIL